MNGTKCCRRYLAELIGTAILILMGCGSVVIAGQFIGTIGIAFVFGLTLLALIYMIGPISGCHVNPAVTVAMLITRKISARHAVGYIIAQCIGAIGGAAILLLIAQGLGSFTLSINGLGQNGFGTESPLGYGLGAAFIIELVMTMIFVLVILGTSSRNSRTAFAGLAIGFTLVVVHLVSFPVTATSVNPARSLGPAVLLSGVALSQLWLFWVAPIIGAILGAVGWKYIFEQKWDDETVEMTGESEILHIRSE